MPKIVKTPVPDPKITNRAGKPSPLPPEEARRLGLEGDASVEGTVPKAAHPAFFWHVIIALTIGCLSLGFLLGVLSPWHQPDKTVQNSDKTLDGATPLQPGPWGDLSSVPIYIEPPEEYLPIRSIEEADRRWRFEGFSIGQLTAFFQAASLTDAQKAVLLDSSKWQQDAKAIYVTPSRDLILSLSPQARRQIYAPMTAASDNTYGLLRCSFTPKQLDDYLSQSGLPKETVALVKQLSYPYGRLVFFCDMPTVLDTLPSNEQKVTFVRTMLRKSTLLLRLHISPTTNIEELARYWVHAGQEINVEPLLESLCKVPGGTDINAVLLFPPLPSATLYNFTFPSNKPEDLGKDCHYTALNFFRDKPDPRFTDPAFVRQTFVNDYYPVQSDPRYGDILVLARPDGSLIHSCVYIADNIVYTKNSANFRDPFILMKIEDMVDTFTAQIPEGQSLTVQYYRNKYY
jgi:hypothetical protein